MQDVAAKAAGVSREVILAGLLKEAETAKEGGTRVRAYELLGKALPEGSMFVDRKIIGIETMTDEELDKRIAAVRAELGEALDEDEGDTDA